MNLEQRIQDGIDGKYEGLSNGLSRVNKYLFNLQKSCYYLLGGMSGTFKTTLADYMVLNAIEDAKVKGIKLHVFYYSYEIDELTKRCNFLSVLAFTKYGREIAPEKIKGLGDNRLTAEEHEVIKSLIPEINELFNQIHFRFKSENPTGIRNELFAFAEAKGTWTYTKYIDKDNIERQAKNKWTSNDLNEQFLVVLDHLYLLKKERGFDTKQVIDKYSEYCISLKNTFGFTFINIQQFNQGLSSVDRAKFKGVDLSPQQTDFKDTTNPFQDSDVALGILNPSKLDMEKCLGYDVKKLGGNMIMLKIIKNRLSRDNIAVGIVPNPKSGSFRELPLLSEMTNDIYEQIKDGKYV
jgi:hypothetical protein